MGLSFVSAFYVVSDLRLCDLAMRFEMYILILFYLISCFIVFVN